jgi:hypothetical protein
LSEAVALLPVSAPSSERVVQAWESCVSRRQRKYIVKRSDDMKHPSSLTKLDLISR